MARLYGEDEIEESVDDRILGNIFHYAAQKLYEGVIGIANPGSQLKSIATDENLERVVDEAIRHEYLHTEKSLPEEYGGDLTLIRSVLLRYLRNIIAYDSANDNFNILQLEKPVRYDFPFTVNGRELKLRFQGISDRVDMMNDGTVRIIDYKTGGKHLEYKNIESLFNGTPDERISNITKTMLYAMMMYHTSGSDVRPVLYYVRTMHDADYSPLMTDSSRKESGAMYSTYREEFEALIASKLTEIYDPEVPFRQCEDDKACRYCDYCAICNR